jgi:phosphohistidine phosphatase
LDLILIRHGEAESAGPAQTDTQRRLTRAGKDAAARTGRALAGHGVVSPSIVTSPKARALETAQILARELSVGDPTVIDALRGDHDIAHILTALAEVEARCVIAVGHMPDLGSLAARLLDPAESRSVAMRTAGYVWIELDAIPPRAAARLVRFD